MFINLKKAKNYLNSNDLIVKGMYKRRRLANLAIATVQNKPQTLRVIK